MARARVAVLVLVAVTLGMTGCGDSDSDSGDGGGEPEETTIEATASEFQFEPASWSVTAGEAFTIDFTNGGTLDHEWAVINLGDDLASEADFAEDKVLLEVEAIPPGESASASFTIDEAGTYQVICAITGHFDEGMEGSLVVS